MIYLRPADIRAIHRRMIERYGGSADIHDWGNAESALAQPQMTFDGIDLYPTVFEKAAALSYSFTCNHAFVDGNKRVGLVPSTYFCV